MFKLTLKIKGPPFGSPFHLETAYGFFMNELLFLEHVDQSGKSGSANSYLIIKETQGCDYDGTVRFPADNVMHEPKKNVHCLIGQERFC